MSVSRHHASLLVEADGRVWLTDHDSTNGTYVNGQRLRPGLPVGLRDGDRLGFGPERVLKLVHADAIDERHHRLMFERAVRDPLTGLHNRAFFRDQAEALAQQTYRRDLGLAILMVDLDHFKRINDTFGHEAGDGVLKGVAAILKRSIRPDDLAARLGGEEFVLAMPLASADQARARGDRLRRDFRALTLQDGPRTWSVTASVGVAFASASRPRPLDRLLREADAALYYAKDAGRDRTALFTEAPRPDPARPVSHGLTTVDVDAFRA